MRPPRPPSRAPRDAADPARRRLLAAAGAASLLAASPALPATVRPAAPPPPPPRPPAAGWRIPGEFEPHRAIWLGYDGTLADTTAALVRALAPHTPLAFLVADESAAAAVRELLAAQGLRRDGARVLIEPTAMYYPRDGAVFATGPDRQLGVVDFRWNQYGVPAWCRRRHAGDAARASACAANHDTTRDALDRAVARLTDAQVLPSPLFHEGGGVESNGQGLLIACEVLLRSRNPGLSRAELERLQMALPGVRRVVWLPDGLAHDPHLRGTITGPYVAWGTGGHTDEFVRFASPDTVLLAWPDDAEANRHPVARLNRQRMQRNAAILQRTRTLDGRPLRVLRVPTPRVVERRVRLTADADRGWSDQWTADFFPRAERRREGDTLVQVATASYLNFVIANSVVVLPDYRAHGTPAAVQRQVQQLFEQAFPQREIAFVDALALNWLGGGLHCATLHEPLPR